MEWARTDPRLRMLPGLISLMHCIILLGLSVPQAIEPISWTVPRRARRKPMKIPNGPGRKNPLGGSMPLMW